MVQTLFMNMFFGGRLKGMPPKLVSDDGRHVVIRPLAYVAEHDLERWAAERAFPIIPCNLCGSQQNLQRVQIREMLRAWEREDPGRIDRIFDAMARVVPSHLMDRNLFAFAGLATDRRRPTPSGDRAFDADGDDAADAPPKIDRVLGAVGALARSPAARSLNDIDADVSSFSRWPAGRAPSTYAFERLPSQQAQPQQAQMLEDSARRAVEGAGFVAAPEGSDRRRHRAARRAHHRVRPLALRRSVLVRRLRPVAPALSGARFGRPFCRPGLAPRLLGAGTTAPYYMREVAVLIRDKRSGEPLYEARAESEGPTTGLRSVAAGDVRRRLRATFRTARRATRTGVDDQGAHRARCTARAAPARSGRRFGDQRAQVARRSRFSLLAAARRCAALVAVVQLAREARSCGRTRSA